ncbi:hypothetical protein QCA50_012369 [Cerrena zonata]|uniref:Uncharacterized protein n=1 Tax=Cerrena zonata TaxID=2478898 RepID=A0AAW0FYM2_9APHY
MFLWWDKVSTSRSSTLDAPVNRPPCSILVRNRHVASIGCGQSWASMPAGLYTCIRPACRVRQVRSFSWLLRVSTLWGGVDT